MNLGLQPKRNLYDDLCSIPLRKHAAGPGFSFWLWLDWTIDQAAYYAKDEAWTSRIQAEKEISETLNKQLVRNAYARAQRLR